MSTGDPDTQRFFEWVKSPKPNTHFISTYGPSVQAILAAFKELKKGTPTYGAILMTAGMDKVLLVQFVGNKGPGTGPWSFPRGKLERKDHDDIFACAVREVRSPCAARADSVAARTDVLRQRYTIRPCRHSQVFTNVQGNWARHAAYRHSSISHTQISTMRLATCGVSMDTVLWPYV